MKNTMYKTIATGIFAFAAMSAGSVMAEVLPDGLYIASNSNKHSGEQISILLPVTLTKVGMSGKNGIYVVKGPGGYLQAASKNDGAKVEIKGDDAERATRWQLHKNSNGWNFLHADNGANALSNGGIKNLKLRRNNAGGKGNSDQLWAFKKP